MYILFCDLTDFQLIFHITEINEFRGDEPVERCSKRNKNNDRQLILQIFLRKMGILTK
jgi:hypothetical protein